MTERDPELQRLLAEELQRHLPALLPAAADPDAVRRAVHALKGSAGLAGEAQLAKALERCERRIKAGEPHAPRDAAETVRLALVRLLAGQPAMEAEWPEPPPDLTPGRIDPDLRAQYTSEVTDRLAGIEDALASAEADPFDAASAVFRHVHAMKGAASAVSDEPMAWFCHGLEERLARAHATRESALAAVDEVGRWRAVLGALAEDAAGGLALLRTMAAPRGSAPPATHRPSKGPDDVGDQATVRVAAAAIDRLLDRFESIGLVRELLSVRIDAGRNKAIRLRRTRAQLAEALRQIGPPRPWGAPAAAIRRVEGAVTVLAAIAEELDAAVQTLRAHDQVLRDSVHDAKLDLAAMRLTTAGRLFARLGTAIEAEARRTGRAVIVRAQRSDETIDRRLAEQLFDPCLQLVRNALAHGLESPERRAAVGKPIAGTVTLTARKAHNRLSITIQDDGAGVDVGEVRRRAVEAGLVTGEIAAAADDDALVGLLFLPGFSTQQDTDLLAGRGIGLDIARTAVQRLGGTVRLSSRRGVGFAARIEVPIESGLERVLWVTAGADTYAVPATAARAVRPMDATPDPGRIPHLSACLDPKVAARRAPLALEVEGAPEDDRATSIVVGVDDVGRTEEVLVRPVGPVIAALGPWAGAIVRGDGTLHLALDVDDLAPRARAAARAMEWRASDRAPRSTPPGALP